MHVSCDSIDRSIEGVDMPGVSMNAMPETPVKNSDGSPVMVPDARPAIISTL